MNIYSNVSKILVNELGCKKCKHRYYRFRNEDYYFYIIIPRLKNLIKNEPHRKIALCGPSKVIYAMVNNIDECYKKNIIKVIDINPLRAGVQLRDYQIEKFPDNSSEFIGVVDTIFIAAQFSFTEIYNSISEVLNYGIDIY
jgi:hypothetical protein